MHFKWRKDHKLHDEAPSISNDSCIHIYRLSLLRSGNSSCFGWYSNTTYWWSKSLQSLCHTIPQLWLFHHPTSVWLWWQTLSSGTFIRAFSGGWQIEGAEHKDKGLVKRDGMECKGCWKEVSYIINQDMHYLDPLFAIASFKLRGHVISSLWLVALCIVHMPQLQGISAQYSVLFMHSLNKSFQFEWRENMYKIDVFSRLGETLLGKVIYKRLFPSFLLLPERVHPGPTTPWVILVVKSQPQVAFPMHYAYKANRDFQSHWMFDSHCVLLINCAISSDAHLLASCGYWWVCQWITTGPNIQVCWLL